MKVKIDSNQLRKSLLRKYLSRSKSNFAVLTDYVAMEAYKADSLNTLYESMSILCGFPHQVIVLKNTTLACGLSGNSSGLQRRFIDHVQSSKFPQFANQLHHARNGDTFYQEQLREHTKDAIEHLDSVMLEHTKTMGIAIQTSIADSYTKEERQIIRSGTKLPQTIIDKINRSVIWLAVDQFSSHPRVRYKPYTSDVPNTFIFRSTLCCYLLILDWGLKGGAKDANPARLRNDLVDMNFVAFATYFDGLMSNDEKAQRIHKKARRWLIEEFGCQLPNKYGYYIK